MQCIRTTPRPAASSGLNSAVVPQEAADRVANTLRREVTANTKTRAFGVFQEMRIDVERGGGVAVLGPPGNGADVHAGRQQLRRHVVPYHASRPVPERFLRCLEASLEMAPVP